jgi:hypothetical protein
VYCILGALKPRQISTKTQAPSIPGIALLHLSPILWQIALSRTPQRADDYLIKKLIGFGGARETVSLMTQQAVDGAGDARNVRGRSAMASQCLLPTPCI